MCSLHTSYCLAVLFIILISCRYIFVHFVQICSSLVSCRLSVLVITRCSIIREVALCSRQIQVLSVHLCSSFLHSLGQVTEDRLMVFPPLVALLAHLLATSPSPLLPSSSPPLPTPASPFPELPLEEGCLLPGSSPSGTGAPWPQHFRSSCLRVGSGWT